MAYKQSGNPFKKKVMTKKELKESSKGSGFFGQQKKSGPYSTVKGDLMSGTDAGLGEFGKTDTKIGGIRRRSGKQVVFGGQSDRPGQRDGFGAVGVGRSLDKVMTDKPKASSRVSADMPAVDVKPKRRRRRKTVTEQAREAKGDRLSRRQKKRLSKGGAKSQRQLDRIKRRAARRARRA